VILGVLDPACERRKQGFFYLVALFLVDIFVIEGLYIPVKKCRGLTGI
jgi:hypothetical protein